MLLDRGGLMHKRRYELTDFEWSIIEPLLPNNPRGVPRAEDRKVLNGDLLASENWLALCRYSRALRSGHDVLQPLCPVAEERCLGPDFPSRFQGLRRQSANDRLL